MDMELLDLHDRCYARQAVVDNVVNRRSCELLEVIKKLRGECDVIKERERAREEESESLRVKCEGAMSDFEKNPTGIALWEKISTLSTEEVDDVKRDRMEVVSKVVPYAAMKRIHNDDLGSLVGRLVSSAIFYGRCKAFEQVAGMKEPFDLSKVKDHRPLYKKEQNQAGNDLATATFPWPSTSKTQALVASSPKATSSFVPGSNPMSPPADAFVVKPLSSQVE
ncbi:hypothetical protein Tco_0951852 [Tanacetum coccineum]|uniref:Uncharacterized protein n=1 Tax=Tanacetum coccineum TaxID=301880 RepID=A0ABQ5DVC1_9ASTR